METMTTFVSGKGMSWENVAVELIIDGEYVKRLFKGRMKDLHHRHMNYTDFDNMIILKTTKEEDFNLTTIYVTRNMYI